MTGLGTSATGAGCFTACLSSCRHQKTPSSCFVGGEKDASRLADLGLVATTSPRGAGKWRDEYAARLTGVRIAVIPDNDEPGLRHAQAVVASFRERGVPAAMLRLDGLPPKGRRLGLARRRWHAGRVDKARRGRTQGAAGACCRRNRPWPHGRVSGRLADGLRPPTCVIAGLLQRNRVYAFTADTGHGKTAAAILISFAVGAGPEFCGSKRRLAAHPTWQVRMPKM